MRQALRRRTSAFAVTLGLAAGMVGAVTATPAPTASASGAQLTWFSGTHTATKNAYARPADASPNDFTSPVNYADGRMYWRLQITAKPSTKPMLFAICMWRHTPGKTDYNWETCSAEAAMPVSTTGTTYADLGVLRSWWTKSNGWDWTKRPDVVRVMIKDAGSKRLMMSTICGRYCYTGGDIDQHVPITMNTAAVIVPRGGTFQAPAGWTGCPSTWGSSCNGSATPPPPPPPTPSPSPVPSPPPSPRPATPSPAPSARPPAPPAGTVAVPGTSGAPASVAAVIANLALTDGDAAGYVTADRCDRLGGAPPAVSSANHPAGTTVSNLSIVPSSASGEFCVYRQRAVQVVADVEGYLVRGTGWTTTPLTARRVLDTRAGGPVDADSITRVTTGLAGRQAAVVNIALVDATTPGYITAGRCDRLTRGPQTRSNGNAVPARAVSNLAIVPLADDGTFCIYSQTQQHLVVDVQAAIGSDPAGLRWTPNRQRLLDTRPSGPPTAAQVTRVSTGLAPGTPAAVVNIALVDAEAPGYIAAGPCSTLPSSGHVTSNANHATGPATSNLALVALDPDGSFCIYRQAAVHLVVDLQAALTATGELGVSLSTPARRLDTRTS